MISAYNGHFLIIKFTLTVHVSLFRCLEIPAVQLSGTETYMPIYYAFKFKVRKYYKYYTKNPINKLLC